MSFGPVAMRRSASRWFWLVFWGLMVLAVVVHGPALFSPLALDDYTQRAMIEGRLTPARGPANLFALTDDTNRASLFDRGVLPWWADANLKTKFLRPLPSALVWLDFKLSGYAGFYPHLHSFAWWAAAVLGAHVLFRRLFRSRTAYIATLFFALSPAHTVPIWWLANRNVLVTVAIGTWALAYHASWRESGRSRDALVTCLLWTATMLTGEYALCLAGYVIAIEIVRRDERLPRRLLGISAFAAPAGAYLIVHWALGFGVHGSAMYRNPIDDFGGYVGGAPRAIGILLGSAWLGIDETWSATASAETLAFLLASAAAAIAVAWRIAVRAMEAREQARATWLLIGSFLRSPSHCRGPAVRPCSRRRGVGCRRTTGDHRRRHVESVRDPIRTNPGT